MEILTFQSFWLQAAVKNQVWTEPSKVKQGSNKLQSIFVSTNCLILFVIRENWHPFSSNVPEHASFQYVSFQSNYSFFLVQNLHHQLVHVNYANCTIVGPQQVAKALCKTCPFSLKNLQPQQEANAKQRNFIFNIR